MNGIPLNVADLPQLPSPQGTPRRQLKRKYTPRKSPVPQSYRSPLYKAKRISNRTLFQPDPTFKNNWLQEMTNQIESRSQTDDMKCDKSVQTDNVDFDSYAKINQTSLEECQNILPVVLDKLTEHSGSHLTLLSFFRQSSSDTFPLDNIAFLLWIDVVNWFDTSNTTQMRYSEDTKLFLKVGWRIFGRRFVNFMSQLFSTRCESSSSI